MEKVYFVDTTLRDGEQTPFVNFTLKEKIKIAKLLDLSGIDEIEAGIPAAGNNEKKYFEKLLEIGFNAKIFSWNRLSCSDINASVTCGVKNVHICIPSSDIHIYKKLKKDKEWLVYKLNKVLDYCMSKSLCVTVGFEDASRADINFLEVLTSQLAKYDIKRIRYADTIGQDDPISLSLKIKELLSIWGKDIEYHGHNDLGMATANAFSAFKGGAKYLSVSVNGLGERAGNTALEEISLALKNTNAARVDIKLKMLKSLSALVEKYSDVKLGRQKPVVGKNIFIQSSGIHIDAMIKDAKTYLLIDPTHLGRESEYVLGKYSGKSAVKHIFLSYGISLSDENTLKAVGIIKRIYRKKKKPSQKSIVKKCLKALNLE